MLWNGLGLRRRVVLLDLPGMECASWSKRSACAHVARHGLYKDVSGRTWLVTSCAVFFLKVFRRSRRMLSIHAICSSRCPVLLCQPRRRKRDDACQARYGDEAALGVADLCGQLGEEVAVGRTGVRGGRAQAACHHVRDRAWEPLGGEADAQVARARRDDDDVLPALARLGCGG